MWTTAAFGDVVEVVEVESGGCLEGVEDFSLTRRRVVKRDLVTKGP
jgi:hypothetical protein